MTHVFTVENLEDLKAGKKTIHIFKSKKPVAIEDKVMFQTSTDEITFPINQLHTGNGLMKDYSCVGWAHVAGTE